MKWKWPTFSFFSLVISGYFYQQSLQQIPGVDAIRSELPKISFFLFSSIFFHFASHIVNFCCMSQDFSFLIRIPWFIFSILYAIFSFFVDRNYNLKHHGGYNSLAFLLFYVPFIIILLINIFFDLLFDLIASKSRRVPKKSKLKIFLVFSFIALIFVSVLISNFSNRPIHILGIMEGKQLNESSPYCKIETNLFDFYSAIKPPELMSFWANPHGSCPRIYRSKFWARIESEKVSIFCKNPPRIAEIPKLLNISAFRPLELSELPFRIQESIRNQLKQERKDLEKIDGTGNLFRFSPDWSNSEAIEIVCDSREEKEIKDTISGDKIFLPFVSPNSIPPNQGKPNNKLNVLILMIDSVSRKMFKRRMKETEKAINEIAKEAEIKNKASFFGLPFFSFLFFYFVFNLSNFFSQNSSDITLLVFIPSPTLFLSSPTTLMARVNLFGMNSIGLDTKLGAFQTCATTCASTSLSIPGFNKISRLCTVLKNITTRKMKEIFGKDLIQFEGVVLEKKWFMNI